MKNLDVKLFRLLLLLLPLTGNAQSQLLESQQLSSSILGKPVNYSIYLPDGYQTNTTRHYPVLYLLHGYTDNETGWTQFGQVQAIADRTISSGEAPPMIIVTPDAGVTWYQNQYDGKVRYEEFMVQEFIKHIDATYRTRKSRESRAVAGLSMGGLGTLLMAMKHPDLFSVACPLSAAVWTDAEVADQTMLQNRWDEIFGDLYGKGLKGNARLTDHYKQNAPIHLVRNGNADELKKVKYYIDCGDDDFLIKGNMELHAAMIDKKIPHEFRVRDGGHTWSYWRTALPEVLKFAGNGFTR